MGLTPEFISAVNEKNLLRVRIMLKDSLLVDKKFYQFEEMRMYAEKLGVDFWMEKTEELEMVSKSDWNMDLMNLELTKLVIDFTKQRLKYCQSIIEKVYGLNSYITQTNINPVRSAQQTSDNQQYTQSPVLKSVSSNNNDYNNILRGASDLKRILRNNKPSSGDRIWKDNDIDAILVVAKKISAACENIKSRRR